MPKGGINIDLVDHQAEVINSSARNICVSGGVGSGKSFIIRLKSLIHQKKYPGSKTIVSMLTQKQLREVMWTDFIEEWPGFVYKQNEQKGIITLKNMATRQYIHAYDDSRGTGHLKGSNSSCLVLGQAEMIPEVSWGEFISRNRRRKYRGGLIPENRLLRLLDCNPTHKGHWIYKKFAVGAQCTEKTELVRGKPQKYWVYRKPDHLMVLVETADYSFAYDGYRDDIIANNTSRYVNRNVYGRWDKYSGIIYDNWNPSIHVIAPFNIKNNPDNKRWVRILAIDWGFRDVNPTAALWCVYDRYNDIYFFYREYYQGGKNAKDQARAIMKMCGSERIDYCYADPSMWRTDEVDIDTSIADQMQQVFELRSSGNPIWIQPGSKFNNSMLNAVYNQLKIKNGRAGAYYFNTMKKFFYERENYIYLESTEEKEPKQNTNIEKPRKKHDHLQNCEQWIIDKKSEYKAA